MLKRSPVAYAAELVESAHEVLESEIVHVIVVSEAFFLTIIVHALPVPGAVESLTLRFRTVPAGSNI